MRSIDMVTLRIWPLGGTAEEAKTIHTLFPDSRVLLGAAATEEAIKAVHAPRVLLLATHGFWMGIALGLAALWHTRSMRTCSTA